MLPTGQVYFPATAVGLFSLSGRTALGVHLHVSALGVHLHVSTHFLENIFTPRFPLTSEICFLLQLKLCDVFAVKPTSQVGPTCFHISLL